MRKLLLSLFYCYTACVTCLQAQQAATGTISGTYGAASYKDFNNGKYLRNWLVAGPAKVSRDSTRPDAEVQQQFFGDDHVTFAEEGSRELPKWKSTESAVQWLKINSATDQVVLDTVFKNTDHAAAVAVAEVISDRSQSVLLGLGSDDAVKVFLNGKLVHKNWVARGMAADNDLVPLQLVKGSNQLTIEVQDMEGGWGFMARILDKKLLTEKLSLAAGSGNLDEMRRLIEYGADVNGKNAYGQTPVHAAQLAGRKTAEQFLVSAGGKLSPMPALPQLVDGLYGNLTSEKRPGIAILAARNGKIVVNKGYGYADIEKGKRIGSKTKFRIGSITKQFTAAALLRLQQQGKLTIQDKLSKYIPDFKRGNEITIHHLLTHTSGIHSFTNTDSFLNKVTSRTSVDDMVRYIKTMPSDFDPGERYEYNNSGYFLAGYIVEKVSGLSLHEFLKKEFFDPLGMSNTGMHSSDLVLSDEALGYNKSGKYERALNWDMSWAGGAGALYSTVEDLYKWNEALFNNKVLSKESLQAAFTPVVLNSGKRPPGTDYGYGWGISPFRGVKSIGHGGGLHGFISQLARVPEENLTIVMLTNQTPAEVELNPLKIAEFFLWQKLDSQDTYDVKTVKVENMKDYEGTYELAKNIVMKINAEGSSLFAQVMGQPKFEIFPMKEDEFFWKVVEAKVKFHRDDKGVVNAATFEQGTFKAKADRQVDK